VIDHSLAFVTALPKNIQTVVDLGSGGGDPGLVIAAARPEIMTTLVDRRAKRTDLLTRLVGRMRFQPHVEVVEIDVALLPQRFPGRTWDAVTCRGFGSPAYTAQHASPLLAQGGLLIVSEPPESDGARWRDPEVAATGLTWQEVLHGVAILQKA
jgi:16S rRNA (guanine527-N7)-methyltransferase